jgi:hypothetical protein
MSPTLTSDALVPLAAVPSLLPPNMPPPSAQTVHRWATSGACGLRLDAVRRGGRWFTSPKAVEEFLAALNDHAPAPAAC